MNIRRFAAGMIVLSMSAVFLSGCQQPPPTDQQPEIVIREALLKFVDVNSYRYELELKGDMNDPLSGKVLVDILLAGVVDVMDPSDPKFSMKVDGSVNPEEGDGGSASGEVIISKEAMYANLSSLNIEGDVGAMPPELEEMLGKWFKVPMPEGTFDELSEVVPSTGDEEQKAAVKSAIEEVNLFAEPKYVGTENIMGESSYHYSAKFDSDAFLEFAKKTAEAQGEVVSEQEIAMAKAEFEKLDIVADIWVGTQSGVVTQFVGNMKFNDEQVGGELMLRITLGGINEPVSLNIPQDAEEFPLEGLLGPALMGPGVMGDPSMIVDPSMMEHGDPSMGMTDEEFEAMMEEMMSDEFGGTMSEEELDAMLESIEGL